MAIKYAPEPKENEKYNVKVTKRKPNLILIMIKSMR